MPRNFKIANSPTQQNTGANSKVKEILKDRLNVRYKRIKLTVDKNTKKRIDQVARKTIRLAMKVKDPKSFEQKYKTLDGKVLTYTPHTAWVQTFGKQPRLIRNCGAAFVPSPIIYGPGRPSRLSDYVAYKSARRSGPCLRFLDIENPTAHQHPMFKEDEKTGLSMKLTRQQKMTSQAHQNSPPKRKAKTTGTRTGGRPTHKLQTSGMRLQTDDQIEEPTADTKTREKPALSNSDNDDQSSTSSEYIAPSP